MTIRLLYGSLLTVGVLAVLAADYRWRIDALFVTLVAAVAAVAFAEFCMLVRKRGIRVPIASGVLFSVLLVLAMYAASRQLPGAPWLAPAVLLLAALYWMAGARARRDVDTMLPPAAGAVGLVCVPFALGFLFALRADSTGAASTGMALALGTIAVIKVGDIAAYFVGATVGRTKLAPRISPNKTVEGLAAQLAAGALAALATLSALWQVFPWPVALIFGLLVSAVGCVGDLAESKLKRICGAKDSSGLLPALGGVLDLIDSVLLGVPFAYILVLIYGKLNI